MEAKIQLLHPEGKKAISMSSSKYGPLKKAILAVLKDQGPSTQNELMGAVVTIMQSAKPAFEGSIPWHTEWVKLDLEARKEIVRKLDSKPARYALPGQ